jgi:gluconolactonase
MRLYSVIGLLLITAASGGAQDSPLIAPGATVTRVAGGFGFIEGPAADLDGNLYFSDIPNARIHRWSPSGGIVAVRENSGSANGLRFDPEGLLLICEMGTRRITAWDPQSGGDVTVVTDRYQGRRFNSPNDLWVDPKGGIYFSDPRYGPTDDQEIVGYHVYYVTPDGSAVRQVTDDLVRPNGIIGTPDGSRVYVADHGDGRTFVYTPADDGSLGNKRLFVSQGADGMTMDERGNVYLTGEDVTIYSPAGE